MDTAEKNMSKSLFTPEQIIDATKWDKDSPWVVLVNALSGGEPWKECKTREDGQKKKSKK